MSNHVTTHPHRLWPHSDRSQAAVAGARAAVPVFFLRGPRQSFLKAAPCRIVDECTVFANHPIAGVNWRPTRFVDEVPKSRLCGLCRMISREIVLLPCLHALCLPCHATNSQSVGAMCPFDQEHFDEEDCVCYELPTRKADMMKVHCWNEAHGCDFEGPMEGMLRHYEKECTFHTSECSRCGERVLHRDLSMHYLAGCGVAVSPGRTETAIPESKALTLQDVSAALEELETPLRDNDEPAVEAKTNAPADHIGNQGSSLAVTPHEVQESAHDSKEVATGVTAAATWTSLRELTSRQSPTEEASRSSLSRSCPEKHIARKPNFFAHMPPGAANDIHKLSWQHMPAHFVTSCGPTSVECHLSSICDPSESRYTWREAMTNGRFTAGTKPMHGCHFEGPMEGMLRHYEEECTFHTAECVRCGEVVLHRDLSTHYPAGCGVAVSPRRTENATTESQAVRLQDVSGALEEVETPFRDYDEPAIERKTNAPADHIGNHGIFVGCDYPRGRGI
ncbi:hypothetical protein MTO96_015932 [Rhipicephalus appendiculatus]